MNVIKGPTETKANKEHRCNFCYSKINKGDIYLDATYKNDEIYSWKTHIDCSWIAKKLNMYEEQCGKGVSSDDFQGFINDEFEDIIEGFQSVISDKQYFDASFDYKLKVVIGFHKKIEK